MTKVKIQAIDNIESRATIILFAACIFFLCSYLYLVNMSVFNIVARKKAENQISQLETKVATLDAQYLALETGKITLDFAHSLGYKDVSSELGYVVKSGKPTNLSLLSNEI